MLSRVIGPLAVLGLALACASREPDGLALLGATLLDGSGGPPLPRSAVVVRRGRIESVGTADGFILPPRTTRVDVSGHWIIPGLIDGHVHLIDPQAGVLAWAIPRYLAWGVTTVRDAHGPLERVLDLRDKLDRGDRLGPKLVPAVVRYRTAVQQLPITAAVAPEPAIRRPNRYPARLRGTSNRPASFDPLHHQDSTQRRKPRILVNVHSRGSAESWLASQPQLLSTSSNEQPS
jgi:hypothetical protein